MAQTQITQWLTIPSMVIARDAETTVKIMLAQRFQEAIDEAAMRADMAGSDAYLDGWNRGEWVDADGTAADAAAAVAADLETSIDDTALAALVAAIAEKA